MRVNLEGEEGRLDPVHALEGVTYPFMCLEHVVRGPPRISSPRRAPRAHVVGHEVTLGDDGLGLGPGDFAPVGVPEHIGLAPCQDRP